MDEGWMDGGMDDRWMKEEGRRHERWMDGWMDLWMDRCMDAWTEEARKRRREKRRHECMGGVVDSETDGG